MYILLYKQNLPSFPRALNEAKKICFHFAQDHIEKECKDTKQP